MWNSLGYLLIYLNIEFNFEMGREIWTSCIGLSPTCAGATIPVDQKPVVH